MNLRTILAVVACGIVLVAGPSLAQPPPSPAAAADSSGDVYPDDGTDSTPTTPTVVVPTRAQLLNLHKRVDALKEQIRRTHTILSILHADIFDGTSSGSHLNVRIENKLGGNFRLTRAMVVLDGSVQFNRTDKTGGLDQDVVPVLNAPISPGDHTVQVMVNLRGHGYGVFSYFRGYRFRIRSSHSFTSTAGKRTAIRIIVYEKGGPTTPFAERPAIRYAERVSSGLKDKKNVK